MEVPPSPKFQLHEVAPMEASVKLTVSGKVPDVGDPDSGIEPGTAFEDIPDDWVCPVCGADKSQFEETD